MTIDDIMYYTVATTCIWGAIHITYTAVKLYYAIKAIPMYIIAKLTSAPLSAPLVTPQKTKRISKSPQQTTAEQHSAPLIYTPMPDKKYKVNVRAATKYLEQTKQNKLIEDGMSNLTTKYKTT